MGKKDEEQAISESLDEQKACWPVTEKIQRGKTYKSEGCKVDSE